MEHSNPPRTWASARAQPPPGPVSDQAGIAFGLKTRTWSVLKARRKKEGLTFGQLIAAVYGACGKRRARGVVRLAVNTHLVAFRGHRRFVIS